MGNLFKETHIARALRLTLIAGMMAGAVALAGCSSGSTRGNLAGGPDTGNPGGPGVPGGPGDPSNPGNPGDPTNPGDPNNPDNPTNPGDPNNPGGPGDPNNPGNPGGPGDPDNPGGSGSTSGPLETSLNNTGEAVDNVLPVGLGETLGGAGAELDTVVGPVGDAVTQLTRTVGEQSGLGDPANGLLAQVGGAVSASGDTIGQTGLPGNLDTGVGGLVSGLGDTVASTGGLLVNDPDNPDPLVTVLDNATGSLGALTGPLTAEGGLLTPVTSLTDGLITGGDAQSVLEPSLANVGQAVDNVVPVGLSDSLGGVGAELDTVAGPVGDVVTRLTRTVGEQSGLGDPASGLLAQVGGAVSASGDTIGQTGLPGNLDTGVGGLVSGLGDTVASTGGLLVNDPDNPAPLVTVLDNATGSLGALTGPLAAEGGLLTPVTSLADGLGVTGGDAQPILEPALANVGQTVDNVVPVGLSETLGGVGATLDNIVSPVAGTTAHVTQTVGDGLGVGQPANQLLTSIGGSLENLGGQAGGNLPGVGGLISGVGATVASVGGIVHADAPGAQNPLGNVLANATGAVESLTQGVAGGATGGLLAPVTGLVGSATGGATSGGVGGLLSPVTTPAAEGAGAAGANAAGSLLAPVTNVVAGATGAVAGVVGGVAASVPGGSSGGDGGSPAAGVGGLLAPVTGVVGALTGAGDNKSGGGLLGGLLGGRP